MIAYKGMDKDMKCLGFQYEVGKEYVHEGTVKCCPSKEDVENGAGGFHACEYPLDVLSYYAPSDSRFFPVEQSGVIDKNGYDSKVASSKIKINAEIGIPVLVEASIEYTTERAKPVKGGRATGYRGAASATGYQGAASATGYQGAASATGKEGIAIASGYQSKVMGGIGCVICLVERGEWNGGTYPILSTKAAIVDGEIIKPGVWYALKNGEFSEAE